MSITFTHYSDDPNEEPEQEITLPHRYEVCPTCDGRGTSSAYLGAFTREDMDEEGPEFMEDYMAGRYDRTCDECKGRRVIEVVDEERANPEHLKLYYDWCQSEYEYNKMCEMERRMGA